MKRCSTEKEASEKHEISVSIEGAAFFSTASFHILQLVKYIDMFSFWTHNRYYLSSFEWLVLCVILLKQPSALIKSEEEEKEAGGGEEECQTTKDALMNILGKKQNAEGTYTLHKGYFIHV